MSETENNTQYKKPKKNKMAIAAVFVGILGILILVLRVTVYRPWWSEFIARNIVGLLGIIGLVMGLAALASISKRITVITLLILLCPFLLIYNFYLTVTCLVCALALPITCEWKSRSKGRFKGSTFATSGVVLAALLVFFWFMETCGPVSTALAMVCGHNLSRLGKAMQIYANDNQGHYPEQNEWCELILKYNQVEREHFYCPGVKFQWRRQVFPWPVPRNEKCYYAMNPDCEPNSPNDIVLLFETKGGWNKFGGKELLTIKNHLGGRRCNVLFNDMHIEFVKVERLGELKWIAEKKDSESVE